MTRDRRPKKYRHPALHLMLRTAKRILKKDEDYIQRALSVGEDYEYISVRHNGDKEYGKVIYVIKENSGQEGFCATLRFILLFLMYAKQYGFVPCIKLTEEFAYYDEEKSREIDNPWEYFFLEAGYKGDENHAKNVVYSASADMTKVREWRWMDAYRTRNYYNERLFNSCSPLIRKYLVLRPEIIQESEKLLKEVHESGGKILGVHFRGTDFKKGFKEHPVFVNEKQMIRAVQKAMEETGAAAVFLATDDASFGRHIKASLGDTVLLVHNDVFRSNSSRSVAFSENSRKYHHYRLGYEIARDMYTLSLCDGLLAGKSSVSFMSNLYKHSRDEAYEYMHIIDNGNNKNGKAAREHRS